MKDHFQYIYSNHAAEYHQMISYEDVDSNWLPALERVTSFRGKRVLDLGTGTGKLPLLFGDQAFQIVGLDFYWAMLRENRVQQQHVGELWDLVQGDMQALPLQSDWAEVVTVGWAIGHFSRWYKDDWKAQIGRVLREMHRVVASTGTLIILEPLGTGSLTPAPPNEALAKFYVWLEDDWGFTRQEISTDLQFASVDEAVTRTEFFFGPVLSAKIREHSWDRVPEWTGVWGKKLK
jgi:ubiquinone/menaquinone biosynthesis C-methylase UbiE